jgi:hypothetical protein
MTGAAALGALVPALIGLLAGVRAWLLARAAQITAQDAAASAHSAHDRIDALPPAPAQPEPHEPPGARAEAHP